MRTGSGENIILIGMPTAGKSTVGVVLAKQLGYDYIDTDLLIQQQEGCRLEEIIRSRGDEAFLDIEAGVCSALRCVRTVIATGGSVIYRAQAMEHLRTLGTLVYLQIDLNSLRERLQDAAARGVVLKPGQTVDGLYRERVGLYERYADLRVDESGKHFEDVVRAVLSALGEAVLQNRVLGPVDQPALQPVVQLADAVLLVPRQMVFAGVLADDAGGIGLGKGFHPGVIRYAVPVPGLCLFGLGLLRGENREGDDKDNGNAGKDDGGLFIPAGADKAGAGDEGDDQRNPGRGLFLVHDKPPAGRMRKVYQRTAKKASKRKKSGSARLRVTAIARKGKVYLAFSFLRRAEALEG